MLAAPPMSRPPVSLNSLLAEMVAVPSVHPDGDAGGSQPGEAQMGAWMAEHLRGLGADVEMQWLAPGRPNVIGVFEPARPAVATVVFAPHLDTVGVAGMTVPPFALTPRAGRLHGRGACDTKGPTAVLKSVGKVDHVHTFTHLLNQRFLPQMLEGENREAFVSYLRSFVDMKIHHIQFNIVDNKVLIDAQKHPENHQDLIVRVAGFSAYFVELIRPVQDQIIARSQHASC